MVTPLSVSIYLSLISVYIFNVRSIGCCLVNSIFKCIEWLIYNIPSVLVTWRNCCFYFFQNSYTRIAYLYIFKNGPISTRSQLYLHCKCVVKVLIPSSIEHTYMLLLEVRWYISSTLSILHSFNKVDISILTSQVTAFTDSGTL